MTEGKYEIEINVVGDGRIFVNYWDYMHGVDVIAELKDGELFDQSDNKITFNDFLLKLEETIKLRKK